MAKQKAVPQDISKLPDDGWVGVATLAAIHGVSVATIWRWVAAGRLPPARKLTPGTTRWVVGEVRAAMAAMKAAA